LLYNKSGAAATFKPSCKTAAAVCKLQSSHDKTAATEWRSRCAVQLHISPAMLAFPLPWRPGLPAVAAAELYWWWGSLGPQQARRGEHGGWVGVEKAPLCREALHEARESVSKLFLSQHLWPHAIVQVAAQECNNAIGCWTWCRHIDTVQKSDAEQFKMDDLLRCGATLCCQPHTHAVSDIWLEKQWTHLRSALAQALVGDAGLWACCV